MRLLPYWMYFRCSECGTLEQARAIMVATNNWDGKLWAFPETLICSGCKSEIFMEGEFPYPESALQELVSAIVHDGCPECGSKDVHETLMCWD